MNKSNKIRLGLVVSGISVLIGIEIWQALNNLPYHKPTNLGELNLMFPNGPKEVNIGVGMDGKTRMDELCYYNENYRNRYLIGAKAQIQKRKVEKLHISYLIYLMNEGSIQR